MNGPTRRGIMAGIGAVSLAAAVRSTTSVATAEPAADTMPLVNRYSAADAWKFHAGPMGTIYEVPADRMRYIFRNMGQFMTHSEVSRGSMAPRPLVLAPAAALADKQLATRLGKLSLSQLVAHPQSYIDGLIVLRGDQILFEAYPRMEQQDRHILWSVTKSIVGHAVGILCDAGKIDPARAVDSYIPRLANSGWAGVSVRDILDMASGIDAEEGDPAAFKDPKHPYYRFEASIGYLSQRLDELSTYEVMASLKRKDPPGKIYEYTSVNSFVLAWLVEEVSGLPMARFVADHIWSRIGADRDAIWTLSPEGATGADGGFSCTLRDLARYGLHHLTSAINQPGNSISAAQFRRITAGGRADVFRRERGFDPKTPDLPLFNSWQWDSVWADNAIYKSGWGGQGLYVAPRSSIVMAWFGTPPGEGGGNELHGQARIISAAAAQL
jgi:CubicO group peptidase (beta-lactamase class C family)